jgi:hypothetical protein
LEHSLNSHHEHQCSTEGSTSLLAIWLPSHHKIKRLRQHLAWGKGIPMYLDKYFFFVYFLILALYNCFISI